MSAAVPVNQQYETPAGHGGPLEEPANRSWWERHGDTTIIWSGRFTLLIAVLVLWQLLSGPVLDPLFVSRPSDVADQLVAWVSDGTLWTHSWITIREIAGGYLLGAGAGVVVGFGIASQRNLARIVDPFMMALYSVPKVALAPLFIVWFGIGLEMKVLLAAVMVFFLVFLNTLAGIREVDRGLIDAARLMGAGRWEVLTKVTLPASLTGVITGLRVAIPYALIGAVIGELVASNRGLGYLISDSAARFNTGGVFAALVVLSIIAAVLNMLVDTLGRRADRWKPLERDQS